MSPRFGRTTSTRPASTGSSRTTRTRTWSSSRALRRQASACSSSRPTCRPSRARRTASACRAPAAGRSSSTPTPGPTAARTAATWAASRQRRSRGTASRSRRRSHCRRWRRSGSCRMSRRTFRVWAPRAESLALRLRGEDIPMRDPDYLGFYEVEADAEHGDDYVYVVDGKELPDPWSRWQPQGLRGPSRVFDAQPVTTFAPPPLEELVLYEL